MVALYFKDKVVQRRLYYLIDIINIVALGVAIGVMVASTFYLTPNTFGLGKFHVGKHFGDFSFTWWILTTGMAFIWTVIWGFLTIFHVKNDKEGNFDKFRYKNWGILTTSILTIVLCGCNFILIFSGIVGIILYWYRIKNHIGTKITEVVNVAE